MVCLSIAIYYLTSVAGVSADFTSMNYYYDKGVVGSLSACPGYYCGRSLLSNGSWSACGACNRGTRRNATSACSPCNEDPEVYDLLYLGFMMLTPMVLHLLLLDRSMKKNELLQRRWMLYVCVALEVLLSSVVTLLITPPLGSFALLICRPRHLRDWYPLLYNPNPNYEGHLFCTQEAVYPMYSIVLVAYSFLLVLVLLMRPQVSKLVTKKAGVSDAGAVYSALYLLPSLTVLHALFAGILYEAFPFLVIVGSIVSCATYFSYQPNQGGRALLKGCVRDVRSVLIILTHWAFHAYGLVSIRLLSPTVSYSLCALIPVPTLFYILTARFSDPSNMPLDGQRNAAPMVLDYVI